MVPWCENAAVHDTAQCQTNHSVFFIYRLSILHRLQVDSIIKSYYLFYTHNLIILSTRLEFESVFITRYHWAPLSITGHHWASLATTGLHRYHWTLLGNTGTTGHHWAPLGFTSITGHHWTPRGTIGYHWAALGTSGYHWVPLSTTGNIGNHRAKEGTPGHHSYHSSVAKYYKYIIRFVVSIVYHEKSADCFSDHICTGLQIRSCLHRLTALTERWTAIR